MNPGAVMAEESLSLTDDNSVAAGFAQDRQLSASYQFNVLTGAQQGAQSTLLPHRQYVIGSDICNDIVLRGAGVCSRHLEVRELGGELLIRCICAPLCVNGISLQVGEQCTQSGLVLIQMGEISFSLQAEVNQYQSQQTQKISSVATMLDKSPEALEPVPYTQQSGALPEVSDTIPTKQTKSTKPFLVFTALALILGSTVVWQSGLFSHKVASPVSLEESLAANSFHQLHVEWRQNTAMISGYLETYQESMRLNQWLNQRLNQRLENSDVRFTNAVRVGETVSERVLDVFRVHGVAASVQVIYENDSVLKVSVLTAEADLQLLDSVRERVLHDVPDVDAIAIENSPPEPAIQADARPVDPGKRVAMVISDIPAYVVTQDQSRYFVGSLLPTGHKIDSIEDGRVMLLKDGIRTALKF